MTVTTIMVVFFSLTSLNNMTLGEYVSEVKTFTCPFFNTEVRTFKKMYSFNWELVWILFIQGG